MTTRSVTQSVSRSLSRSAGGLGVGAPPFTTGAPAWLLSGSPKVDLDFENSRFWINDKHFTSLANMLAEGTLQYDSSGARIVRLDTALSGPTYQRCDHTTNTTTTTKTLYELWDSATGGNLGGTTPQNSMALGWFHDGTNRLLTWIATAAGADQVTGTTWTKVRAGGTRARVATRNDLNLHSHTVNNAALQTDTSCAILTGLDRIIIGNRRQLDRPSNSGSGGEAIHRFTLWQATINNAALQALSV